MTANTDKTILDFVRQACREFDCSDLPELVGKGRSDVTTDLLEALWVAREEARKSKAWIAHLESNIRLTHQAVEAGAREAWERHADNYPCKQVQAISLELTAKMIRRRFPDLVL